MRISTLQVLGVVVPTATAFAFEAGLMFWSDSGPDWRTVVGRTALMAVATLVFTGFMFKMIQEKTQAVLAERRRIEALFQSSCEAILVVDAGRRVRAMNSAASRLLGERGLGFSLCQLCPASPEEAKADGCSSRCAFDLGGGNPFLESVILGRGDVPLPVSVSTSVLPPTEGDAPHALIGLRDISERRALERARVSQLVAARTLEAQEEERRRIAQELHDGIGQELYGLRLAAQMGQPVEEQIVTLMEGVQRLATSLYPPVLGKLGLAAALRSHVDRLWGLRGELRVEEDFPRLSRAAEAAVFRLVQEALGNALRHGQASSVRVHLFRRGDSLGLTVADDGIGFVPSEAEGQGLGLASMQERIESLGGRFEVRSAPGQGAVVAAELPLSAALSGPLVESGQAGSARLEVRQPCAS